MRFYSDKIPHICMSLESVMQCEPLVATIVATAYTEHLAVTFHILSQLVA